MKRKHSRLSKRMHLSVLSLVDRFPHQLLLLLLPYRLLLSPSVSIASSSHSIASPDLKRSAIAVNLSPESKLSQVRSSSGMFIRKTKDPIVAGIEDKISSWFKKLDDNYFSTTKSFNHNKSIFYKHCGDIGSKTIDSNKSYTLKRGKKRACIDPSNLKTDATNQKRMLFMKENPK